MDMFSVLFEYREVTEHDLPTISITDGVWVEIFSNGEFGVNVTEYREDDEGKISQYRSSLENYNWY